MPVIGEEDEDEEDEYDEESSDDEEEEAEDVEEEYDDEYDEEEEEEEEVEEVGVDVVTKEKTKKGNKLKKYDEPFVASPLTNLYCSLAIMLLGRKVDLFNPTIVRIAR